MKLGILSALAVAVTLSACTPQDSATVLAQAKSDIATAEQALAVGTTTFCAMVPQLQVTADAIISVSNIDAKTAASVAAGKAAAAIACTNPSQANLATVAIKIAAAKAAVSAALANPPK